MSGGTSGGVALGGGVSGGAAMSGGTSGGVSLGGGTSGGVALGGGTSGGTSGGLAVSDAGLPSGESCSTALPLSFGPTIDSGGLRTRRAQVNGSTLSALDDHQGTCGGSGAPELVYRFDLLGPARFEGQMQWVGVSANPALYLRASPCTPGFNEVACDTRASAPPTTAIVTVPRLDAGSYFLFADGRTTGQRGPFSLTVDLFERGSVGTCASPEVLSFDAGIARAEGNTRFLADAFRTPCAAALGGGEQVYRFDVPSQQDVTFTIASVAEAPILSLHQGTCAGPSVWCNTGSRLRQVTVPGLAAGTYTLVVDAWSISDAAAFAVTATLGSFNAGALLPGDTCFNAQPLVLSNGGSGTATVAATTSGYFKDTGAGSCPSDGADRVFTFDTTSTRTLTATITSATPGFMPTLIHRSGSCGSAGSGDRCQVSGDDGGLPTLTVSAPPGRQYLVVDGPSWSSAGDFTLVVTVQ